MANKDGREALRGAEALVLDLIAQVLTSKQWAELLKDPLERAAFLSNKELAQKLISRSGAKIGDIYCTRPFEAAITVDLLENGASVAAKDQLS